MTITWRCAPFAALTTAELYRILRLRQEVFVVEQNCDAQMRAMLVNELEINPAQLVKVLHYDGTPITARYITRAIRDTLQPAAADSQKEAA